MDDAHIAETITVAIALFELWMLLPNIPQVEAERRLEWTSTLVAEAQKYGAPSPAPVVARRRAFLDFRCYSSG